MSRKAKSIIALVVVAVLVAIVYDSQRRHAQAVAERDSRCQQERTNPPATFEKSADCILWSKSK